MAKKKVRKLNKVVSQPKAGRLWFILGAAIVVLGIWGLVMRKTQSPVGINEVAEVAPINLIDAWEFDVSADMGENGWVAKRFSAQMPNPSNLGQLNTNGNLIATTIENGMLVIPGNVGSEVALVKTKGLTLPETMGDLRVRVVASAVVPPAASPKVVNGITIPAPKLKGQFSVGNPKATLEGLVVAATPEVSGSDIVYNFRISADMLKMPGVKQAISGRELRIYLSTMGIVLSSVKIDSITISTAIGPVASTGSEASLTTVVGTLRPMGSGQEVKCVIVTAQNVNYQVIYTGPNTKPVASPVKGCPAALADFVRKNVTASGTLVGNTKLLRIKSLSDIVVND